MGKKSSYATFIAERVTRLRLEQDISEYKLSLDLGFSKGYIQAVSSGNIMPSLDALYKICDYFNITPAQFFSGKPNDSMLFEKLASAIRELSLEEQYTLYHFLKGGKLPRSKKAYVKKTVNPAIPVLPPLESDK